MYQQNLETLLRACDGNTMLLSKKYKHIESDIVHRCGYCLREEVMEEGDLCKECQKDNK